VTPPEPPPGAAAPSRRPEPPPRAAAPSRRPEPPRLRKLTLRSGVTSRQPRARRARARGHPAAGKDHRRSPLPALYAAAPPLAAARRPRPREAPALGATNRQPLAARLHWLRARATAPAFYPPTTSALSPSIRRKSRNRGRPTKHSSTHTPHPNNPPPHTPPTSQQLSTQLRQLRNCVQV
jgi:hypothetical protein